jgi:hypothetical protein
VAEWTINVSDGHPRLVWFCGNRIIELNIGIPSLLPADKALPPRPELDILAAILRYSLERVEAEIKGQGS